MMEDTPNDMLSIPSWYIDDVAYDGPRKPKGTE